MGLFQKRPIANSSVPLYSLGLQKNLVIIGLGNVGKEYDGTRHNIGFEALDHLAKTLEFPEWTAKRDLKCHLTMTTIADRRVILVKPTTFMNASGEAFVAVRQFYKVATEDFVIVHDELAIPFGQIRLRRGGSDAGNNGLKSIISHEGEQTGRVRVGIKNDISEKADAAHFVLGKFSQEEKEQLPALLRETNAILSELIHGQELVADTRSFII